MKKMKKLNSKGFTLIELIAVIVILGIVILIAATTVGGSMTNARKSALLLEGEKLVGSAAEAFASDMGSYKQGTTIGGSTVVIAQTTVVCYTLATLKDEGFYENRSNSPYVGSVLVSPVGDGTKVNYTYWISNGTHYAGTSGGVGHTAGNQNRDDVNTVLRDTPITMDDCGGIADTNVVIR